MNNHDSGIIWLASYPKSGNTWTRVFLHNLLDLEDGAAVEDTDINALNRFSVWDVSAKRYAEILGVHPRHCARADIAAVRPLIQQQIADEVDGLAFVKTHNALVMDRGYPTINMKVTSGAVYIVRNPLDIAASLAHHIDTDIDTAIGIMGREGMETRINEAAIYEVYGSWSAHVESWTRTGHRAIHVMRYEDMNECPAETFRKLADFLLVDPSDEVLQNAIELSAFTRLSEQEEKSGFQEKPQNKSRFFRKGKSGGWRQELSRAQVERIIADHGPVMRRFGYLPER